MTPCRPGAQRSFDPPGRHFEIGSRTWPTGAVWEVRRPQRVIHSSSPGPQARPRRRVRPAAGRADRDQTRLHLPPYSERLLADGRHRVRHRQVPRIPVDDDASGNIVTYLHPMDSIGEGKLPTRSRAGPSAASGRTASCRKARLPGARTGRIVHAAATDGIDRTMVGASIDEARGPAGAGPHRNEGQSYRPRRR
jgi:hypothetical protein